MLAPAPEKDPTASPAPQPPPVRRHRAASGLFDPKQLLTSLPEALRKLHPRVMVKNPVMFVVEVGSALTTLSALVSPSVFAWLISLWLWLTVVFANLAEAVAEGRGKAQAESLRKARTGTVARRLLRWRVGLERCPEERVPAEELLLYDFVVVEAGETVPGDGDVVEGVAAGGGAPGRRLAVAAWVHEHGGQVPPQAFEIVDVIAAGGGTPLMVAVHDRHGARPLGVIQLKDVVKNGISERFAELRRMGIRTVMVTGDNPLTARAIAAEAGVDDFLAEATPEDKLALIRQEQEGGKLVAMTGDGTNDAPALAQADVGVAMNTGTSAAKEAGNMVDLDSNPTKLIDIVEIGKQLLITRGALTTFSIANDVAKYFAIIPAMFAGAYPGLRHLNIMALHSPTSAITSAIIFNALIIIALIPLALRGVRYRPASASDLLGRNLRVYGLGGLVLPFVGIKLVDLLVQFVPGL
ncbi:HAD-IC family P-type ATPase [Kitasatospora herbaricolor]|uniref:HAD-IC family P-type ATPase n=1 Tax=Kitasatospora herbaricolor TaxID=68217 RepID=A0ABZ1WHQ6_9ACTN|nr:HAD-IC family P-type ATPase [Kitasatospora herbaricolor]